METAYFEEYGALSGILPKFAENIIQCIDCRVVWISNYKMSGNGDQFTADQLLELERCVELMNTSHFCVNKLAALKTFISHGLCRLCLRKKLLPVHHREQRRNGYHTCFATAVDGDCTQKGCCYYTICVVDQEELRKWNERVARQCSANCRLKNTHPMCTRSP